MDPGAVTGAGCRVVELADSSTGAAFPVLVLYPGDSPQQMERLGRFPLRVALNGEIAAGRFPLVIISHGNGGSHLVYRDLAAHLARQGFIVATPEHPFNNRNNNSRQGTAENLRNRPMLIRQVIDWLASTEPFASSADEHRVAIIGHSMGGYTALAAAGAIPSAFAHESPDGEARVIELERDERVKALVLLAPATTWLMAPGALAAVRTPVLMLTAEHDPHTPPGHAEILKRGLPPETELVHRVVPNAGHFSFLSSFPPEMTQPAFAPSQDPAGFDRASFQDQLGREIIAFLAGRWEAIPNEPPRSGFVTSTP